MTHVALVSFVAPSNCATTNRARSTPTSTHYFSFSFSQPSFCSSHITTSSAHPFVTRGAPPRRTPLPPAVAPRRRCQEEDRRAEGAARAAGLPGGRQGRARYARGEQRERKARDLANLRFKQIWSGEKYDPELHGYMIIVEPGDSAKALEKRSGCPRCAQHSHTINRRILVVIGQITSLRLLASPRHAR